MSLSPATFYDDNGVVRLQGQLDGGGGGTQAVLTATLTLTAADLQALNGTGVEIVPAPGTGKVILPVRAAGLYQAGATPYANNANAKMALGPAAAPDITSYTMLNNTEIGAIFSQATSQVFFFGDQAAVTAFMAASGAWDVPSEFEDLGLVIGLVGGGINPGSPPLGDGTCKLWVSYVTADLS